MSSEAIVSDPREFRASNPVDAGTRAVRWSFPSFEPPPFLKGGHAQTIAGRYLPGRRVRLTSEAHLLALEDGDRLHVWESVPATWKTGEPLAVLVHGLGGCARASYVVRVAERLYRAGARVIRMNLRGAGDGFGLARGIYHSGRTEDLRRVAAWVATLAPDSPIGFVGFSLGANLVLKLAAEATDHELPGLDCVVAANPPLDLAACCRTIREPRNWIYDRNFVAGLKRDVARLHRKFPDLGPADLGDVGSVYEFDDRYTAPRNGFAGADEYYARCSAGPMVGKIRVAGLVVHAADDPFIPVETVRSAAFPSQIDVRIESHGGHLGYLSRARNGDDRRWLDACIESWFRARWTGLVPRT